MIRVPGEGCDGVEVLGAKWGRLFRLWGFGDIFVGRGRMWKGRILGSGRVFAVYRCAVYVWRNGFLFTREMLESHGMSVRMGCVPTRY